MCNILYICFSHKEVQEYFSKTEKVLKIKLSIGLCKKCEKSVKRFPLLILY